MLAPKLGQTQAYELSTQCQTRPIMEHIHHIPICALHLAQAATLHCPTHRCLAKECGHSGPGVAALVSVEVGGNKLGERARVAGNRLVCTKSSPLRDMAGGPVVHVGSGRACGARSTLELLPC